MDIVDVSLPYWDPEYISFWWVGGPSNPDVMSVTFPDALEVPPEWVTEVPAKDMAFPLQLPIGWIAWQMVGTEVFFDTDTIGGDPRCSLVVAHSYIIWVDVDAEVEMLLNTLNLASNGKWIQARIELPEGYSAGDVDVSSIRINNEVPVDPLATIQIGDSDGNGKQDFTVKFDRAALNALLGNIPDLVVDTGKSFDASLTITGDVKDTWFSADCTVRVLRK